MQPNVFGGTREESWKNWSRKFKAYCNARKHGFKDALNWAEKQEVPINFDQCPV